MQPVIFNGESIAMCAEYYDTWCRLLSETSLSVLKATFGHRQEILRIPKNYSIRVLMTSIIRLYSSCSNDVSRIRSIWSNFKRHIETTSFDIMKFCSGLTSIYGVGETELRDLSTIFILLLLSRYNWENLAVYKSIWRHKSLAKNSKYF